MNKLSTLAGVICVNIDDSNNNNNNDGTWVYFYISIYLSSCL